MNKSIYKSPILHVLLLFAITFLVYCNILHNEFIWDDNSFIPDWKTTHELKNIPQLLAGELPEQHENVFRPVRSIAYAVSYHFFESNAFAYHLLSIIIHLTCTILVYLIILQLSKGVSMLALMSSLLFAVHPIHVEAISWIATSFDIIGIIFFLAAFYLYLLAAGKKKKKKEKKKWRRVLYLSSVATAVIAFFTYELTLTLPILIILHDLCFRKIACSNILQRSKVYLPYWSGLLFYLIIRFVLLKVPVRDADHFAGSAFHTFLLMVKAVVKYASISFLPLNLSTNHIIAQGIFAMQGVENQAKLILSQSIFNLDFLLACFVFLTAFYLAFRLRQKHPVVTFFTGWFLITLLPVLNIIPTKIVLAEKYAYLASLGTCTLISYFIYIVFNNGHKLINKNWCILGYNKLESDELGYNKSGYNNKGRHPNSRSVKILIVICFVATFFFYSLQTIDRNNDWKNEGTLWKKTIRQAPQSVFANYNMGGVFITKGDFPAGIKHLALASKNNPKLVQPYLLMESIIPDPGREDEFVNSLGLQEDPLTRHYIVGNIYFKQKDYSSAIDHLKKTLNFNQHNSHLYYKLGVAYFLDKNFPAAIREFRKAIELDSEHAPAHKAVGLILLQQRNYPSAIRFLKRSIAIEGNNADAWESLGVAYHQSGHPKKAVHAWEESLKIEENQQIRKNILSAKRIGGVIE